MGLRGLLCVFLVVICSVQPLPQLTSHWLQDRPADGAPEDKFVPWMLEYFGRHPETLLDALNGLPPDMRAKLPHDLDILIPKATSPECMGCELVVRGLKWVQQSFVFYAAVRPFVVPLCNQLTTVANISGDILCAGVCDNYGPPLFEIARKNLNTAFESCYMLNYCSDEDLEERSEDVSVKKVESLGNSLSQRAQIMAEVIHEEDKPYLMDAVLTARGRRSSGRDTDTLRVAQLTDIHVDEAYLEGSFRDCYLPLCCHEEYPGKGSAGPHGEYNCNVPPSTTEMFMQKIADLNPDIVLYTGDSPPHHLWKETLQGMMNVTLWVGQKLQQYFPGIPVYSSIGNHESFPSNLYYTSRDETIEMLNTFIKAYGEQSGFEASDEESVRHSGHYSRLIQPGLRVVNINSNFGYTDNWYNLLLWDEEEVSEMMQYVQDAMAAARSNQEKVILLTHHPVGSGIIAFDEWLTDLFLEYSDIIVLSTCGHTHKEEWRLFLDGEKVAKHVQFVSQSANSYSNVNPGVRMYMLDRTTFQLLDFEQYYLDINSGITPGNVELSYRMSEEYSLDDLSPQAIQDLVYRMKDDDELFQRFWRNRRTLSGIGGECNDSCKEGVLCGLLSSTKSLSRACSYEDFPDDLQTDGPDVSTVTVEPTPDNHGDTWRANISLIIMAAVTILYHTV